MQRSTSKPTRLLSALLAIALAGTLGACAGSDGTAGPPGARGAPGSDGADGADGSDGTNGANGTNGTNGGNVQVANFHGAAFVLADDEAQGTELVPPNPKYFAQIAISSASADPAGVASVAFTVKKKVGLTLTPVTGLTTVNAGIFKLAPPEGDRGFTRWVPYLFRSGRTVNAGYRESNGTLTEVAPGSYVYRFAKNLSTARYAFDPTGAGTIPAPLVGYDRTLTHRVSVYMGGHQGPTGEADYDFVPDGRAVTVTRNIVQTAACKKCHGDVEFHGHGGDRVTVEGCNTCHSPDSAMVNGAIDAAGVPTSVESIEMQVMIHKIHAGRELQSAPGVDGVYFDDPTTVADESADNGTYRLGSGASALAATWRSAAFPAGLANCTVCHTGTGADVDNWKTVPSRSACGSCHDLVNFATGTNHSARTSDASCAGCHGDADIVGYHDFMTKDIRNEPEFVISVAVVPPANGQYFVKGESPVVNVVLKDFRTGTPIDHTTVVEDGSGEGCVPDALRTTCTNAADGQFRAANMYVTGPRAKRVAVLTTPARARVSSFLAEPWDLSLAANAQLRVVVDQGNFVVEFGHVGADIEDVLVPGDLTVTLPASALVDGTFANSTAVTAQEVVDFLMGDAATFDYNERTFRFRDRAIAYVESGKVSIRTRALGTDNPTVQIPESGKNLAGLFTDYAVKVAGSAAQLRQRTTASNNDPKLAWFVDHLEYTLDPVDDLVPGTYMINLEFADRGRPSNAANYRTPSIAVTTFQVKTATVEKPIADSCTSCHWNTNAAPAAGEKIVGSGFVLDPVRHNKPFNAQALDQCGGCHDYASGETAAAPTWTTGGSTKAISKRVHSIHNGANLLYPVITVDHEESVVGRGWKITYPQSVRNCQSCHSTAGTTGTWATGANRLACMGCHDKDAATTHMKIQVYDPTPLVPWSGDEQEACVTCH